MGNKVLGFIPARWNSDEIKNKIVQKIGPKPLIQWVYERVRQAPVLSDLYVATDHENIAKVVQGFGGKVVMTSNKHKCGTDRIAEAFGKLHVSADIVVNIQGDEPFIDPLMVEEVARPLLDDPTLPMGTLCCDFASEEAFQYPFNIKVVRALNGDALYFSRSPIPYPRHKEKAMPLQHIGIYSYRADFLQKYPSLKSPLEDWESLEQLRALENGYRIRVVKTQSTTYARIAINTYDDLERARQYLEKINTK